MAELRVVRHTDRFADACRFYGEILGWPITKQWDEPDVGRIYGYGDTARVELLSAEPGTVIPPIGVTLAVEVEDVAAVHEAMAAAQIHVHQPLADQPWGHRNFAVTDPTGLPVVFFQVVAP
jgi:catechol 2,3-dioxygenase-like lactoylglutathione lyase family enzyme